jgi:hypothetical protein
MASSANVLLSLFRDLEAVAYNLAKGRALGDDVESLVSVIGSVRLRGGAPLVGILRDTAPRLSESSTARRQFFHAARALVTLHRV